MSGPWDKAVKRWVGEVRQDFISWLFHGAVFECEVSSELKHRTVHADLLYRVLVDDCPCMFHVEFQSTSHPHMAQRMWEYNMLATIQHKLPVHSFLIYLKKGEESDQAFAKSPFISRSIWGEEIHRFSYSVLKLWEIPTQELFAAGYKGLLPLVPLTAQGLQHEAVEHAITQLAPVGEEPEKDLLSLLKAFGSLRYNTDTDLIWFKRRFDLMEHILEDSWFYQELQQQSEEKARQSLQQGIQQGIQQGMQQGVRQGLRQGIVDLVQKNFPSLTSLAQERVELLKTSEQLRSLLFQVASTQDEQDIQRHLLAVSEE